MKGKDIYTDLFAEFDVTDKIANEIAHKFFGCKVQYEIIHEFCGYHFDEPIYSFNEGIITLLIFSKYGHPYGSTYPHGSIYIGNICGDLSFRYQNGELQIKNLLRKQHNEEFE